MCSITSQGTETTVLWKNVTDLIWIETVSGECLRINIGMSDLVCDSKRTHCCFLWGENFFSPRAWSLHAGTSLNRTTAAPSQTVQCSSCCTLMIELPAGEGQGRSRRWEKEQSEDENKIKEEHMRMKNERQRGGKHKNWYGKNKWNIARINFPFRLASWLKVCFWSCLINS